MSYARKSWSEERSSWHAVILLNLVRSVNIIVDVLGTVDTKEAAVDDNALTDSARAVKGIQGPSLKHRKVMFRLAPLRQIEKDLKNYIGAGSTEIDVARTNKTDDVITNVHIEVNKTLFQEFCIRSSSGWKSVLDQIRHPISGKETQLHRVACHVVASCREEIRWLWEDSLTQQILEGRQLRLEDSPGL